MRFIFVLCLVCLTARAGISPKVLVSTRWVMPRQELKGFDLQPQERTRPILVGDIIYYVSSESLVYAIHRISGYVLWKTELPSKAPVDGAFSYGRSKLYIGDTQGNLYALNARDGSEAWRFKINSEWLSPPIVSRDRVIAAASNDELWALGENDGKEKWHYSRKGDEKMTIRGTSGPSAFGNEVYHGFSDGYVVALTVGNGKPLWTQKLRTRSRFYDVDMQPYVDEESVLAATYDGNLYRLDRNTGEPKWVFRVGSYGGFLVEENKVYFSGLNGNFYALDKDTGSVVWKTAFNKGVGLTPVRSGEHLVFTTSGDPFYLLDPSDGKIVATGDFGAGTMAAPVGHAEGWFYCLSNFGNLYSFEIQKTWQNEREPETLSLPSALRRIVQRNRNQEPS